MKSLSDKPRLLIAFGTRPEVIKCYPLIRVVQEQSGWDLATLHTGQHTDLTKDLIEYFGIQPDHVLDTMIEGQPLHLLQARLIEAIGAAVEKIKPDYILAQGDTMSVLCLAQVAFYKRIPFIHLEAGLRTFNRDHPFPEEMIRQQVSRLANLHLAPTQKAAQNLLKEGIVESAISIVGNTVVDALLETSGRVESRQHATSGLFPDADHKILMTVHRRENHGENLLSIAKAIRQLASKDTASISFLIPMHPNPTVRSVMVEQLGSLERVALVKPLDYPAMVRAMLECDLILSDSGGIQEEAPALGKPVLVLRDHTERTESLQTGITKLVGTEDEAIVDAVVTLLETPDQLRQISRKVFPYGDGTAAQKALQAITSYHEQR